MQPPLMFFAIGSKIFPASTNVFHT
jgi:hypothetical protein